MNNNKKYKKWSLGLVAPALVLAPIAVVASCSSSSEDTKIDLTKLVYTIALKDNNSQEIQLSDQNTNSVDTITNEKLIDLVLANKTNILDITGTDATKINDDVLKKEILSVNGEANKDKTTGKITFTLNVAKPKNGAGEALTKEITFTGFKVETDSTTPTEAYTIGFNAKDTDSKYALTTVAEKTTEDYPDIQTIKPLLIQEKSVIFKATKGELPSDNAWWESNLVITNPKADAAKGEITVTIQLNKSDSSDESANIKEENVVLKGFKLKPAAPAKDKFKIKFKGDASEFTLPGVDQKPVTDFSTPEKIKELIISNKAVIFDAEEGKLPTDKGWWTQKLQITNNQADAAKGQITVNISLADFDTTDSADQSNTTLTKNNVVLKGFKATP